MATFADLIARIADDLARSNLSTQIGNEILAAIEDEQVTRFYFNETRSYTFNTVASQSDYPIVPTAAIDDFITVDKVQVTIGARVIDLRRDDWDDIDYWLANSAPTGQPFSYAYYAQTFRLYPIPNAIFPMRIEGHFTAPVLVNPTDANIWTTEAFQLTRAVAKASLYANVIKDSDQAQLADAVAQRVRDRLIVETSKRVQLGQIIGTDF